MLAKIFPPIETTDLCNCMFFSPKLEFKVLYNRFKAADFESTISSKNKEMLVVEGHELYVKRINKFTTAWNCSKY